MVDSFSEYNLFFKDFSNSSLSDINLFDLKLNEDYKITYLIQKKYENSEKLVEMSPYLKIENLKNEDISYFIYESGNKNDYFTYELIDNFNDYNLLDLNINNPSKISFLDKENIEIGYLLFETNNYDRSLLYLIVKNF